MILAGTGHRPDKLGGYDRRLFNDLCDFAAVVLTGIRPSGVISGMALGWDQALAVACVRLSIPFVAAVPFVGFESRWPSASQEDFKKLIMAAEALYVVCEDWQVADAGVPWGADGAQQVDGRQLDRPARPVERRPAWRHLQLHPVRQRRPPEHRQRLVRVEQWELPDMTILKDGRDRQIECEECSETTSVYDSEDFEQMVGNAKDAGWAITREDGRYTHKCPDCAGVSSLTRQQALFR